MGGGQGNNEAYARERKWGDQGERERLDGREYGKEGEFGEGATTVRGTHGPREIEQHISK